MSLSPMIGTMQKRELLYTMNGKPIYRDEMRPIGESSSSLPWGELLYLIYFVGVIAGSAWVEFH